MSDYNIYCDESCHLENDGHRVMVLGALWCPLEESRKVGVRLREIKRRHGLPAYFEMKWTKISPAKVEFYMDVADYFFDDDDLHFRGLLVPDKTVLHHAAYDQDHDDWYYKMCFQLLEPIIDPRHAHFIYLDIKDTRSERKRAKLEEILRNRRHHRSSQIVRRVQQIRSHESELMQLTDLLIGAIGYRNRLTIKSSAKKALVERIEKRSGKKTGPEYLAPRVEVQPLPLGGDKVLSDADAWLPTPFTLSDADGIFKTLIERAYEIFRRDFIESQPNYLGLWVRCRRDPIEDGKEAGFWHCTSEGREESNRTPALRRCERIEWIRAIIENSTHPSIHVWDNIRRGETNTLLWYREEFLVVLAQRTRSRDGFRYYQLITAYDTPEEHRKRKLRKEKDEFFKRLTPPFG